MSAGHRAEAPAPLGWRIATVLGVIFGLFILAQDFDWLLNIADWSPRATSGASVVGEGKLASGVGRVEEVRAGSPAAAAGIVRGDRLTFDPAWQMRFKTPQIGERFTVTVAHGGERRIVLA